MSSVEADGRAHHQFASPSEPPTSDRPLVINKALRKLAPTSFAIGPGVISRAPSTIAVLKRPPPKDDPLHHAETKREPVNMNSGRTSQMPESTISDSASIAFAVNNAGAQWECEAVYGDMAVRALENGGDDLKSFVNALFPENADGGVYLQKKLLKDLVKHKAVNAAGYGNEAAVAVTYLLHRITNGDSKRALAAVRRIEGDKRPESGPEDTSVRDAQALQLALASLGGPQYESYLRLTGLPPHNRRAANENFELEVERQGLAATNYLLARAPSKYSRAGELPRDAAIRLARDIVKNQRKLAQYKPPQSPAPGTIFSETIAAKALLVGLKQVNVDEPATSVEKAKELQDYKTAYCLWSQGIVEKEDVEKTERFLYLPIKQAERVGSKKHLKCVKRMVGIGKNAFSGGKKLTDRVLDERHDHEREVVTPINRMIETLERYLDTLDADKPEVFSLAMQIAKLRIWKKTLNATGWRDKVIFDQRSRQMVLDEAARILSNKRLMPKDECLSAVKNSSEWRALKSCRMTRDSLREWPAGLANRLMITSENLPETNASKPFARFLLYGELLEQFPAPLTDAEKKAIVELDGFNGPVTQAQRDALSYLKGLKDDERARIQSDAIAKHSDDAFAALKYLQQFDLETVKAIRRFAGLDGGALDACLSLGKLPRDKRQALLEINSEESYVSVEGWKARRAMLRDMHRVESQTPFKMLPKPLKERKPLLAGSPLADGSAAKRKPEDAYRMMRNLSQNLGRVWDVEFKDGMTVGGTFNVAATVGSASSAASLLGPPTMSVAAGPVLAGLHNRSTALRIGSDECGGVIEFRKETKRNISGGLSALASFSFLGFTPYVGASVTVLGQERVRGEGITIRTPFGTDPNDERWRQRQTGALDALCGRSKDPGDDGNYSYSPPATGQEALDRFANYSWDQLKQTGESEVGLTLFGGKKSRSESTAWSSSASISAAVRGGVPIVDTIATTNMGVNGTVGVQKNWSANNTHHEKGFISRTVKTKSSGIVGAANAYVGTSVPAPFGWNDGPSHEGLSFASLQFASANWTWLNTTQGTSIRIQERDGVLDPAGASMYRTFPTSDALRKHIQSDQVRHAWARALYPGDPHALKKIDEDFRGKIMAAAKHNRQTPGTRTFGERWRLAPDRAIQISRLNLAQRAAMQAGDINSANRYREKAIEILGNPTAWLPDLVYVSEKDVVNESSGLNYIGVLSANRQATGPLPIASISANAPRRSPIKPKVKQQDMSGDPILQQGGSLLDQGIAAAVISPMAQRLRREMTLDELITELDEMRTQL